MKLKLKKKKLQKNEYIIYIFYFKGIDFYILGIIFDILMIIYI